MRLLSRLFTVGILITFLGGSLAHAQATFTWNGRSGTWNTPAEWTPNGIPGPSDTAVVDDGVLTIDSAVSVGGLSLAGGTITGPGNLTVLSRFRWQGGRLSGSSAAADTAYLAEDALLELNGTQLKDLVSRTLILQGTTRWSSSQDFRLFDGAVVINETSADFNFESDATLDFASTTGGRFINRGTVSKRNSGGNSLIEVDFYQQGLVDIQSGQVRLVGMSESKGAVYRIESDAQLQFNGENHQLEEVSFGGAGIVQMSDARLNVTGAGMTVEEEALMIMVGSGSLLSGDGPVVIDGAFDWKRATITGSGAFTVNNRLTISGTSSKTLDGRTLTNRGTLTWIQSGTLRLTNNALILNAPGATLDLQNDAVVAFKEPEGGTVDNQGLLRKSQGSGTSTFDAMLVNSGTVSVDSGTVRLVNASDIGDGRFTILEGTTLLIESGDHRFGENATLDVQGTLAITGGETHFSGYYSGPGTIRISGGTFFFDRSNSLANLNQTGGVIGGNGNVRVNELYLLTRGTITGQGGMTVNGSLELNGGVSDIVVIDGGSLSNGGTAHWRGGGDIRMSNGGVLVNQEGGLFEILTDANIDAEFSALTSGSFQNGGIISKSNSPGTTNFDIALINTGTVNVNSGTLRLTNGSSGSGGIFNIGETNGLEISSKAHSWTNMTFTGEGDILFSDLDLTVKGNSGLTIGPASAAKIVGSDTHIDGEGPLNILGKLEWGRGTVSGSGPFLIHSELIISGDHAKVLDGRTMTNMGRTTWLGNAPIRLQNNAVWLNQPGSIFDIQNDQFLISSDPAGGRFENRGTVTKTAGDGITTIQIDFDNYGVLEGQSGILRFTRALNHRPLAFLRGSGIFDLNAAVFDNQGIVAPGNSPGQLSIFGTYRQTPAARLDIELGGPEAGTGYDQLVVNGQANLGGILNITLGNDYLPAADDTLEILKYNLRLGQFVQFTGLDASLFEAVYTPTGLLLTNFDFPANAAPLAQNDAVTTPEDTPVIIDVLANDSDPDEQPLSLNSFTQPLRGTVQAIDDNRLQFTPPDNYAGETTFSYLVSDGFGGTARATVTVTITAVNDAPVFFPALPDISFLSAEEYVLDLDPFIIDVDHDTSELNWTARVLAVENQSPDRPGDAGAGVAVDRTDLQISIDPLTHLATFTATTDSFGIFRVEMAAGDPAGGSAADTMAVAVRTRAPEVIDPIDNVTFAEDSGPHTVVEDLNTTFSDPDSSGELRFQASSEKDSILATIQGSSLMIDTPPNFFGSGNVTVTAEDASGATTSDVFLVIITPVNDLPAFSNFPATVIFRNDSSVTLALWEMVDDVETDDAKLEFAFDAENDSLLRQYNAANGELTLSASPGFFGQLTLTIEVTDEAEETTTANLAVTIEPPTGLELPSPGSLPRHTDLAQNYPNPFNPATSIRFQLAERGKVYLAVYNILGQKVRTLVNQKLAAGFYETVWNGLDEQGVPLATGVYLYRLKAGTYQEVRKMILLK